MGAPAHAAPASRSLSAEELVARLGAGVAEVLDRRLPLDRPLALIDYPSHGNPGDNAIWLGETAYLRRAGARIAHLSDPTYFSAPALRRHPEMPILIHGGGNLGDIYLNHERLREQVIDEFTDRPIVQLPQTIHFDDEDNLLHAKAIFD